MVLSLPSFLSALRLSASSEGIQQEDATQASVADPADPCRKRSLKTLQRATTACALASLAVLTFTSPTWAAGKTKVGSKTKAASSNSASKPSETSAGASATASAVPGDGPGDTIVFFDAGIRSDLGTFVQKETVGRATITDEAQDSQAFGPLMHVGFLTRIGEKIRVGSAFGYGMNYTIVENLTSEQKDNDQEPNRTEIGQLLTLDLRLEWNQQLSGPVWLTATPIIGVTAILAGGALKEETDRLDGSHNTSKGPRLGFIAGGELGIRYQYNNWFSFKFAGGYGYTFQSLLSASLNSDVADSKRNWRLQASRLTGALALEASF